jgi:hypothetical protein
MEIICLEIKKLSITKNNNNTKLNKLLSLANGWFAVISHLNLVQHEAICNSEASLTELRIYLETSSNKA